MSREKYPNPVFWFGDEVYLKTDRDQGLHIVTGLSLRPGGITYKLSKGTVETDHYDFEIATEKNVLITTSE